jgi:tetratricopeptide (TPR) repeat protein
LEIFEKVLEPDDTDIKYVLLDPSILYMDQSRYEESESYLRKALLISKRRQEDSSLRKMPIGEFVLKASKKSAEFLRKFPRLIRFKNKSHPEDG